MTQSRPYLLRAIYDWLIENDQTPYLLVDAEAENVTIPLEHVQDGKIILNVSMTATRDLDLSNEAVTFNARFGGKPMMVYVPIMAALALYSKENGRGMMFPDEVSDDNEPPPLSSVPVSEQGKTASKDSPPKKSHLTLVK